jgi:YfiH family protein
MANNKERLLASVDKRSRFVEREGVGVIMSERLIEEGVTHGFTTRRGGVSAPPFDTLNMGTTRDEPMENILENYRRVAKAYGLRFSELALVRHEHGDKVLRLDRTHCGRGLTGELLDFSDGLVTCDPFVTLMTCHADCGAFFIFDKRLKTIGLAHAGWKGMKKRIGQRLVETMQREFGSRPSDMIVALGPCICEKCFEVEKELAEEFANEFDCPDIYSLKPEKPDKGYVSLRAAAIVQLLDAGVCFENISLMEHCTFEERELFFSFRRDGRQTGSMAAFMRID